MNGIVPDELGLSAVSYAACDAAFHDTALSPAIDHLLEALGIGALWGAPDHTLTDSEAPVHTRLRRALTPWFTPKRVAELRSRTASLVDELLAAREPGLAFDVMSGLADVVPARAFCWMLGAGDDDAALMAAWSKALILVFTATPEMVEPVTWAKAEIAAYARELLAHKRRHPDDGLATVLATSDELSEADAVGLLEELLSAAVDNTANTTGCAFEALARHPDQWRLVADDVTTAVDECARFQPAIRHTIKYATRDTSVLDEQVAAGTFVTLRIAAAHRDPSVFPDPEVLDVTRPLAASRLDFGAGRHYCIGAALARMEVSEMVGGVCRRWRTAEIADGARDEIVANGHVFSLPLVLS